MGNAALPIPNPDYEIYPGISPGYINTLKGLASVVCVLSIIGAVIVIQCYYPWRNSTIKKVLRCCCSYDTIEHLQDPNYKNELLPSFDFMFLIFISICDIIVAFTHLWGIFQNLEKKFIPAYQSNPPQNIVNNTQLSVGTDVECTVQATLLLYSTFASFLWTLAMMIYICYVEWKPNHDNYCALERLLSCINVAETPGPRYGNHPHCCNTFFFKVFLCPLFAFGFPAVLIFSLALAGLLGFSESLDTGWCSLLIDTSNRISADLITILGYEVWVWFPLVFVLFFSLCYCCLIRKTRDAEDSDKQCMKRRYILVAFVLVGLRLPNSIIDVIVLGPNNYKSTGIALLTVIAAICNSAQGLCNAIIFLFPKRRWCSCCCC